LFMPGKPSRPLFDVKSNEKPAPNAWPWSCSLQKYINKLVFFVA
jgi:hypothetical protein